MNDEKQRENITWDEYFINLCYEVSKKSKDPSTKVGAIIVYPDHGICSTGFNGFPRGMEDLDARYDDREFKIKAVVHAEANAILNAGKHGHKTDGCILYVPWHPCSGCAKQIDQAGIKEVVIDPDYPMTDALRERWREETEFAKIIFREAKIPVRMAEK